MANDFQVGEDWTDSVKDFATSGTLASGAQTITGDIDSSGTITGVTLMQGANQSLDSSDLDDNGGTILQTANMLNAGLSAPISPIAGTFWYDTTTHILKIRDEDNLIWLSIWDLANNKPITANIPELTLQQILSETAAYSTMTTVIPVDDTIPQITEGTQVLSADITPQYADSLLRISALWTGSASIATYASMAIFQDAIADAVLVSSWYHPGTSPVNSGFTPFQDFLVPGTGTYTYTMRVGPAVASTLYTNGIVGSRVFGGICKCYLQLEEIQQ